jgi:hypothetical protein
LLRQGLLQAKYDEQTHRRAKKVYGAKTTLAGQTSGQDCW